MPDGKIEVELRLLTENARKQAASSAQDVKKEFDKVNMAPPNITYTDRGTGSGMSDARQTALAQLQMQRAQGLRGYNAQDFFKQQGGGGLATPPPFRPSTTPTPGTTTLATMAENVITKPLSGPMQGFVKLAAGVAAFRVGLGLASFALRPLSWAAGELAKEFRGLQATLPQAAGMWAKVLQSRGLPSSMTTQGYALGKVFGVSSSEVYRLGLNMGEMAQKTAMAADSLRRNMGVLTGVEHSRRVAALNNEAARAERMANPLRIGFSRLNAKTDEWASRFNLWTDRLVNNAFKAMGFSTGGAPNMPRANVDRITAGPMERAGLVLGNMGIGNNPAMQTARNTAEMKSTLKTIATNTANRSNSYYQGNASRP